MSIKIKIVLSFFVVFLSIFIFRYYLSDDFQKYKSDLIYYSVRHLYLVGYSMLLSCLIGIGAGIILSRPGFRRYSSKIIQLFNISNAIPTMAVLAMALVTLGIGDGPSVVALIFASLLPIVYNTYEGLLQVPKSMVEAAVGIGMTAWQRLWLVEFPNSLPVIFGGIRTALAINVGTAPLSFIIGGESLGGMIFPGIYLNNSGQLILGAVATAVIALLLDMLMQLFSKWILIRRGLA